jgi:hypothetical protein
MMIQAIPLPVQALMASIVSRNLFIDSDPLIKNRPGITALKVPARPF